MKLGNAIVLGSLVFLSIGTLHHAHGQTPPQVRILVQEACEDALLPPPPKDAPRPQDRVSTISRENGRDLEIIFLRDQENRLEAPEMHEDAIVAAFQKLAEHPGGVMNALPDRIYVRLHARGDWGSRASFSKGLIAVQVRDTLQKTQAVAAHELGHLVLASHVPIFGSNELSVLTSPQINMLAEFFADAMAWVWDPGEDVMSAAISPELAEFRKFPEAREGSPPQPTLEASSQIVLRFLSGLSPKTASTHLQSGHILGMGLRVQLGRRRHESEPVHRFVSRLIASIKKTVQHGHLRASEFDAKADIVKTSETLCDHLGWIPQ